MADTKEDEEELDYHVTFPLADPIVEGDTLSLPKREPVVMLLGWFGCIDKHLAKYSAIYQSKGYTTIRYTAPTSKIISNPDSLRENANKLLELLFDLGLDENPIIFHVFSNSGGLMYRHCLELMSNGENSDFQKLKLAGSVLDSTPCNPSAYNGLKAMYYSKDKVPSITLVFMMLFFILLMILEVILPSSFHRFKSISTYMKSFEESPSKLPQLFLYSKVDKLCDYKTIEDVIAKRQAAGVEVWQVCWEDSEHVLHLLKHRDEYIDTILQFADLCLGKENLLMSESNI